jgi:signal transduction histidine kinase
MRISLRGASVWIGVIVLLMIPSLLITFPFDEAIGYVIIYPTALFLFSALSYMARQAEEAQSRSESLLADLQQANIKLQEYAAQVQELAAAEERNRLARELHDSVTQIIFSLTLSAQAARILINRDTSRAISELDHLQSLAQSALAEMRTLIQELHPLEKPSAGLVPSLNQLVAERKANEGVEIDLQVNAAQPIPAPIEKELFRIAQEAVNNIVKHAQVKKASIILDLNVSGKVRLVIEDSGVGFDPARIKALPGHLGLTSMHERVQALGGTLAVQSRPGQGTRLCVELSLEPEVAHD